MNTDPLDDLLKAYAKQPLPPPAPFSKAEMWREIETRRRRPLWSGLIPVLSWRELFAEPRLAITGLVLALVTGIVPVAAAHTLENTRMARASLHLDVFTNCPSCVPANGLASHQRR